MTETFKKANNIMKIIANSSACMVAYNKLSSADFWVKKDGFDYIKKETDSQFWHDVFKLDYEERFMLGFRQWDDDKEHLLIPLWIVECLPDDFDIEVNSIGGRTCSIKDIDKDICCGCVAYMV